MRFGETGWNCMERQSRHKSLVLQAFVSRFRAGWNLLKPANGGEGGIRTPDRLAPMPHFECGAFDHSATSPGAMTGDSSPAVGASSRRGWRARQGAGGKKSAGSRAAKRSHKMEHLRISANGATFHV